MHRADTCEKPDRFSSLKVVYFLLYRQSNISQNNNFFVSYSIDDLLPNWLSTRVQIHENQRPRFGRSYIITNEKKKPDEHGASFQSSPKIDSRFITRLICIQWKSTTPDQLASPSKLYSLRLIFSTTEVFTCSKVINAFNRPVPEKVYVFRINLS